MLTKLGHGMHVRRDSFLKNVAADMAPPLKAYANTERNDRVFMCMCMCFGSGATSHTREKR